MAILVTLMTLDSGVDVEHIMNEAVSGSFKTAVVGVASQKVRNILYKTPMLGKNPDNNPDNDRVDPFDILH